MKKISSISIIQDPDYDADMSDLGTFGPEPKDKFAVNHHKAQGFANRNTFEWFNPQPGICETKKDALSIYERMMDYEKGNWYMLSISATAHIQTSQDGKTWKLDKITSGGLYGIESDADESDKKEIASDQLQELKTTLQEFGFTKEEIDAAPIETKTK